MQLATEIGGNRPICSRVLFWSDCRQSGQNSIFGVTSGNPTGTHLRGIMVRTLCNIVLTLGIQPDHGSANSLHDHSWINLRLVQCPVSPGYRDCYFRGPLLEVFRPLGARNSRAGLGSGFRRHRRCHRRRANGATPIRRAYCRLPCHTFLLLSQP